jgi:Bacterial regulatory proteins, luxR family
MTYIVGWLRRLWLRFTGRRELVRVHLTFRDGGGATVGPMERLGAEAYMQLKLAPDPTYQGARGLIREDRCMTMIEPVPTPQPSPAQLRALGAYLHALTEGNGGKQAAADCGIAYQTFRNSIEEAYRRLGVTNAIQAAVQLGLLVPSNA